MYTDVKGYSQLNLKYMKKTALLIFLLLFGLTNVYGQGKDGKQQFTDSFNLDDCTFLTTGRNLFFILEPGYQLILKGIEEKDTVKLEILVLNETKTIDNTETRIVIENESVNNQTIEIARNYFAFCKETGTIFYFGEDVDNYKDGKIINHDGSWLAEGKNSAGVLMPGLCLLGAKYYQEIAPDVAMDRAEIISLNETFKTPLSTFTNCLKTEETNPLKLNEKEYKIYAPGIGLIKDGDLILVNYGYKK